jgi:hypothetical protein
LEEVNYLNLVNKKKSKKTERERDGKGIYNDWMEPEFLHKLLRTKYTAREMLEDKKRDEENHK